MRKRSYLIPMKATMMNCDRQLVEKEMCLGQVPTCDNEYVRDATKVISTIKTFIKLAGLTKSKKSTVFASSLNGQHGHRAQ